MKLKKLLKYLDPLAWIVVWHKDFEEEEEPVFEGCAMEIPYWLTDCRLYNNKEDDIYGLHETEYIQKKDDKDIHRVAIVINVED